MKLNSLAATIIACATLSGCYSSVIKSQIGESGAQPSDPSAVMGRYYLPTGAVKITGKYDSDLENWDLSYEATVFADASSTGKVLYLYHSGAHLYDDDANVEVDSATGLLQTVDIASTDKTGQILADTVAAIKNGLTFAGGLAPTSISKSELRARIAASEEVGKCDNFKSFSAQAHSGSVDVIVKPGQSTPIYVANNLAAGELAQLIEDAPQAPIISTVAKLDFTLEKSNNALDTTVSAQQANDRVGYDGVAIKWPVPYELSVTRQLSVRIVSAEPAAGSGETAEGRTGAGQATASRRTESDVSPHKKPELVIRCFDPKPSDSLKRQVMLPSTEFSVIPLSRRLFVADRTTLTISNGMLGAVHFVRPSDAAGAIGIPKTVLESLAPIPLELRNNNTNNINSIIDLKAAEKKLRDGG